jgi:FkbM family methyltransferase
MDMKKTHQPKFGWSTVEQLRIPIVKLRESSGFSAVVNVLYQSIWMVASKTIKSQRVLAYYNKLAITQAKRFLQPFYRAEEHCYDFQGIRFPDIKDFILGSDIHADNLASYSAIYRDTLYSWINSDDKYDRATYEKNDKHTFEGLYCYSDGDADITIHVGDVVLDLGAWIGDFSAYAAKKGATCYAFEPSSETIKLLERTKELNKASDGEIIIVPFGAGAKSETLHFKNAESSTGSRFVDGDDDTDTESIEVVALDDWVRENNLRVDFIKADIEGAERDMLSGAAELLRTQAPTLSLCTYHYRDDPQIMRELILKANPEYKIIQKRMKLFAYVPKSK